MAHPYQSHKNHQISKDRVSKITHGAASAAPKIHRASGGRVHPDEAQDKKLIKKMIGAAEGPEAARRADRVERRKGGRVGKKPASVNINVISAPSAPPPGVGPMPGPGPGMPPPPSPAAGAPPAGMMPPRPPVGAPGGAPSGLPPMMARARGGSVKSGPAWEEGKKSGTPVEHDPGKNQKLLKPSPPKRATGGKVGKQNAPQGVDPATKLPGGAGGGLGRLAKASKYGGK